MAETPNELLRQPQGFWKPKAACYIGPGTYSVVARRAFNLVLWHRNLGFPGAEAQALPIELAGQGLRIDHRRKRSRVESAFRELTYPVRWNLLEADKVVEDESIQPLDYFSEARDRKFFLYSFNRFFAHRINDLQSASRFEMILLTQMRSTSGLVLYDYITDQLQAAAYNGPIQFPYKLEVPVADLFQLMGSSDTKTGQTTQQPISFSKLRRFYIDRAIRDLNDNSHFVLDYDYIWGVRADGCGKRITGLRFTVDVDPTWTPEGLEDFTIVQEAVQQAIFQLAQPVGADADPTATPRLDGDDDPEADSEAEVLGAHPVPVEAEVKMAVEQVNNAAEDGSLEANLAGQLMQRGVQSEMARRLTGNFNHDLIQRNIHYFDHQAQSGRIEIHNPGGYLKQAIERDFAGSLVNTETSQPGSANPSPASAASNQLSPRDRSAIRELLAAWWQKARRTEAERLHKEQGQASPRSHGDLQTEFLSYLQQNTFMWEQKYKALYQEHGLASDRLYQEYLEFLAGRLITDPLLLDFGAYVKAYYDEAAASYLQTQTH